MYIRRQNVCCKIKSGDFCPYPENYRSQRIVTNVQGYVLTHACHARHLHVICLYTTWLFIIDKTFSMKIILLFFFLGDKTMGLRKMALAHTSGAAGFVSREGSYGRNRRQNCSIRQKSQKTVRYQVRIHTIHSYLSHIIARTS